METSIADRLRQIEIEIAEIRQHTVKFDLGVNSPYCELLDAGGLILDETRKLRGRYG